MKNNNNATGNTAMAASMPIVQHRKNGHMHNGKSNRLVKSFLSYNAPYKKAATVCKNTALVPSTKFENNNGERSSIAEVQRNQIFSEIDQDDFEEPYNTETFEKVKSSSQMGAFRPSNMLPVCTLENGSYGIYAKRVQHFDGKSCIALVYYRPDGSCTDDICIDNSDIFAIALASKCTESVSAKKEAQRAVRKIAKKVLAYWDGTAFFDINTIIATISSKISELPTDSSQTPDIKTIYAEIVDRANEASKLPNGAFVCRKGYYAFEPDRFEKLANDLRMSEKQLINMLIRHELLRVQPSSMGYQCKVKGIGYCYCILTIRDFQQQDIEPNTDAQADL